METKYTEEKILSIRTWVEGKLFSFVCTRWSGYRFAPGQFARLGVRKPDGLIAWRAYSIVSANWAEELEFFSIVVPGGEFTSELDKLKVGGTLFVEKKPLGFLTLDRFEGGKDLWLLSTGTGLAPFLSILYSLETWERYEKVILVHAVRTEDELAYRNMVEEFAANEYFGEHADKLIYVPIVSREKIDGMLSGRITNLLVEGSLEQKSGQKLCPDRARIMICGNPEMVDDTRVLLTGMGYKISRKNELGHIAVENYW